MNKFPSHRCSSFLQCSPLKPFQFSWLAANGSGCENSRLLPTKVAPPPHILTALHNMLACPDCHHPLVSHDDQTTCLPCQKTWRMQNQILDFLETSKKQNPSDGNTEEHNYTGKYYSLPSAHAYDHLYRNSLRYRWRTYRELNIIDSLLALQPPSTTMLDLPSGGGRITPILLKHAQLVVEADISFSQLIVNQMRNNLASRRVWMTASAFAIPLQDECLDATVCIRLAHHLHSSEDRQQLIHELLRVSRRFVILSFTDANSLKNRFRQMTTNYTPKNNYETMANMAAMAKKAGGEMIKCKSISPFGTTHLFALILKKG